MTDAEWMQREHELRAELARERQRAEEVTEDRNKWQRLHAQEERKAESERQLAEEAERQLLDKWTSLFPHYAWTDARTAVDLMAAEITTTRTEIDAARALVQKLRDALRRETRGTGLIYMGLLARADACLAGQPPEGCQPPTCPRCAGSGRMDSPPQLPCGRCGGSGQLPQTDPAAEEREACARTAEDTHKMPWRCETDSVGRAIAAAIRARSGK